VPVLVAYNIPQRDCGGYSANSQSAAGYRRWVDDFVAGLAGARGAVVVILEPDALPDLDCLGAADQATRLELLRYAIRALAARPGVLTYVDAGNAEWHPASTMAMRLRQLGTAGLAGFALNVSNFFTTTASADYGDLIANALGGLHYIVDTSRNGLGPTGDRQWCNPPGRALGDRPTAATGRPLADAYLWVKAPGESDGSCGGAPAAGEWMPGYALGLVERAGW
jgi:endoglucanase